MDNILDRFKKQNIINQCTNLERLKEEFSKGPVTYYLGIDPTNKSLHIGHLFTLITFLKLLKEGNKGILIFGGATAKIGDPTGKSETRKFLKDEEIDENINCIEKQVKQICLNLDIDVYKNDNLLFVNNMNFFKGIQYIDFLRSVGIHFSVKKMLTYDTYKTKMEDEKAPFSFIEFNYAILQAYDFYMLYKKHNCILQIGGSDQWGNITAGTSFIKRIETKNNADLREIYGFTIPILLNSDGKKMGKTEKGAIFLNQDMESSSPFEFFQYFRNVDDRDAFKLLNYFTFYTIEEIDEFKQLDINIVKEKLAFEVTKMIHGKENAESSLSQSKLSSKNKIDFNSIREQDIICLTEDKIKEEINILDICIRLDQNRTKTELKKLIKGGGVSINEKKIIDVSELISNYYSEENKNIGIKIGKKYFGIKVE